MGLNGATGVFEGTVQLGVLPAEAGVFVTELRHRHTDGLEQPCRD